MFGFIYLGVALVSHLGYKAKEFWHNSLPRVDKHTNTYYGYDGGLYVAGTKKRVHWAVLPNGDEVLYDRPGHIYRNISAEERQREFNQLRNDRNGATAYKTKERRTIKYYNPATDMYDMQRGAIYLDLDTKREFVCRDCLTGPRQEKEFYALATDPYKLVRISDEQVKLEMFLKQHFKENWIDHPYKEKEFIEEYNKTVPVAGIIWIKG